MIGAAPIDARKNGAFFCVYGVAIIFRFVIIDNIGKIPQINKEPT